LPTIKVFLATKVKEPCGTIQASHPESERRWRKEEKKGIVDFRTFQAFAIKKGRELA
jgi:hypothetical protein